jgi:hypothetical protein
MKLRVRFASGGETHKLSLPELTTVSFLKKRISAVMLSNDNPDADALSKVRVSLNKRNEVGGGGGEENKTLQAVGIANGDLVFVLEPLESASINAADAVATQCESRERSGTSLETVSGRGSGSAFGGRIPLAPPRVTSSSNVPPGATVSQENRRRACLLAAERRSQEEILISTGGKTSYPMSADSAAMNCERVQTGAAFGIRFENAYF